jgi:DNA-binding Xre family transcriptional regulator
MGRYSILLLVVSFYNTLGFEIREFRIMSQTGQLLSALKKCLRARGMTYRDLAKSLDISEASVKRIFSQQTFTLGRLEDVCRVLDMSIYDLAKLTRMRGEDEVTVLTRDQEQALADDSTLLTYFYLLLIGWTPESIAAEHHLDELQQTRILTRLDRLKLLDLYPKNRVRLRTSRRIVWRTDGAIRKQYERQVKDQFMKYRFRETDELFWLETSELSDASLKVLIRKLEKLSQEFDELAELDLNVPRKKKRSIGLMLALRPWTYWQLLEPKSQQLHPAKSATQGSIQ